MKSSASEPGLSLEKNCLLGQAYYKYARNCGQRLRMKDTLKAKHVLFHRYVITPEEREEIERDKKSPFYSGALIQDVRRSKCITDHA